MSASFASRGEWRLLAAAASVLMFAGACSAGGLDLTGMWYHPNGDSYAIRQDGAHVWWYGKGRDDNLPGKTWSHVFHGKIHGKQINGSWADVPPAKNRASGTATYNLIFQGDQVVGISGEALNGTVRRTRPK